MSNDVNKQPWWKGASIYQIYPRSFFDSSGNGVGDLKGITSRLEYIADLGVDAIWVSPFFTSPMKDYGYDVADYRSVDPLFGQLRDFETLIEKSHKLNLKVIIDQVYSHTSDQHEWFKQSRQNKDNKFSDWYVWEEPKPDGMPPSNWQSPFGGPAWTWDNRRKQYYLHNFLPCQPDLNLHNEEVQQAIFDVARFWLEKGVDGFRLDAIHCGMHNRDLTDHPPRENVALVDKRPFNLQMHIHSMSQPGMPAFLQEFRKVINDYGDIFTVAEVGGDNASDTMKSYIKGNDRLSTAYSFDFLLKPELTPKVFKSVVNNWQQEDDDTWPSWAFSNHDAPRVLSRWGKLAKNHAHTDELAKMYLMLLCSLRGNIFMYQGEELGLKQSELAFEELKDPEGIANWPDSLGRDGARTPIPWEQDQPQFGFSEATPWLPVNKHQPQDAISAQQSDPQSNLNFTKQMLALRNNSDALKFGKLKFVEFGDDVIAYTREQGGEKLLCVFNHSDKALALSSSSLGNSECLIANVKVDSLSELPAFGAAIYKIN